MKVLPLVRHITRILPLSVAEQTALAEVAHLRNVRKRQYLLEEGDICSHYHFVLEGCFRLFTIDDRGIEHIIQFATEDWWIADIGSFHAETPSRFFIEALEPSRVLRIAKADLLKLYVLHPVFNQYFRVLIENAFVGLQKRTIQNISATAGERYDIFLSDFEHLVHRIPQRHIAAFIGVTPEFLSKLRKDKRDG